MGYYQEPLDYFQFNSPLSEAPAVPRASRLDPVDRRMLMILTFVLAMAMLWFTSLKPQTGKNSDGSPLPGQLGAGPVPAQASGLAAGVPGQSGLSPLFAQSVRYWEQQILGWAALYGLEPNMVATVMQIESCGDPQAISSAGAQGLFQVMPFHFAAGENSLDPDTNAKRGMGYLVERLAQTNGDVGRAFAGYNGGHVAAAGSWDNWANETQRYYVWSTGIYSEVQQGLAESSTLNAWMEAGGASLCNQAATRLGL